RSLAWPGWVWKCIPRSVPRREREWLSCTNATSTPASVHASARKLSRKKPRASWWTSGARRTRPVRRVSRRCTGRADYSLAAAPAPAPSGPGGHQTLSAYIADRFDDFSRSQKDVAQYIVDHLDEAAFQTAEALARRANTSSSTVVRFSQALGFEGFPELQQAAREEYRRRTAPANGNGSTATAPLFSLDQNEFET